MTGIFTAQAKERNIEIRTSIDSKYLFCEVKTNGVPGYDNRASAMRGEGAGTTSTNSYIVMSNGENELTVEVGALDWFSKNAAEIENKETFNPAAYCKAEMTLVDYDNDQVLNIATLEIKINEQGIPTAYLNNVPDNTVVFNKTTSHPTERVTKNKAISADIDKRGYPDNMTLYQFTKSFTVSGLPDWQWGYSEPYTGSPEQIVLLKEAYSELWLALKNKDIKKVRKLHTPAAESWAITTQSTVEKILDSQRYNTIYDEKHVEMKTIDWDNFYIIPMNNGKMVRMVYKETLRFSPVGISYVNERGNKSSYFFSPIFSLVNGKYIPVI
ncbi:hypothetical protein [Morganella psychrotolerans]|nr:hypothetical protein [Morganella psychrotolerans]